MYWHSTPPTTLILIGFPCFALFKICDKCLRALITFFSKHSFCILRSLFSASSKFILDSSFRIFNFPVFWNYCIKFGNYITNLFIFVISAHNYCSRNHNFFRRLFIRTPLNFTKNSQSYAHVMRKLVWP